MYSQTPRNTTYYSFTNYPAGKGGKGYANASDLGPTKLSVPGYTTV